MKTNLLSKAMILLAVTSFAFFSCEKDDNTSGQSTKNLKGMFVVCEGGFNLSNGDITYYNENDGSSITNVFQTANGAPLGDIVQSFTALDNYGFFAVNNSQKLTIVDIQNFKTVKTIDNLSYPRCIIPVDENTLYLSNGNGTSNNNVYVVDKKTLSITDTIAVGKGPESMAKINNNVYVCNSGASLFDTTVMVINTTNNTVTDTIKVGHGALDIEVDNDNNAWVFCNGGYDAANNWAPYESAKIFKINTTTNKATLYYDYQGSANSYGMYLITMSKDKKKLYFVNGGIYELDITQPTATPVLFAEGSFYAVATDPVNNYIIGMDATNKKAIIYNGDTKEKVSEVATGTNPNATVFIR